MQLLESQVHNQSNFAKSEMYQVLVKRYCLSPQKQIKTRKNIVKKVSQSIQILNKHAFNAKQKVFQQFKQRVQTHTVVEVPRHHKKSVSLTVTALNQIVLRSAFTKLAVSLGRFRFIQQPESQKQGVIQCLNYNYCRVQRRLAFRKFQQILIKLEQQKLQGQTKQEVSDLKLVMELNTLLLNTNIDIDQRLQSVLLQSFQYLSTAMDNTIDTVVFNIKSTHNKIDQSIFEKQKESTTANRECGDLLNECTRKKTPSKQIISKSQVEEVFSTQKIAPKSSQTPSQQNEAHKQEFTLSSKRDLLYQMLEKSQTILNFTNVSQSLSELYLQHISKHADSIPNFRALLIQRSKSALMVPLLDIATNKLVGSIELYRNSFQSFDGEQESRVSMFAYQMSKALSLFLQLKSSQQQLSQAKKQLTKKQKTASTLSSFLRHTYFSAPALLNASQVLPILIFPSANQTCSQRLAFFYQFKDNHIYNFDYSDTFIEEIVERGYILEVSSKHEDGSSIQENSESQLESERSDDVLDSYLFSHRGRDIKRKQLGGNRGKVQTITNEDFSHIVYYPVLDKQGKTVAILEVGFAHQDQVPEELISDQIKVFLDQFKKQIQGFSQQLKSFCASLTSIVEKKNGIEMTRAFSLLKSSFEMQKQREQFLETQKDTDLKTEHYFNEYVNNLESYDTELRKLVDEREQMVSDIQELKVEKKSKLKFLASALFFSTILEKKVKNAKAKNSFYRWKQNINVTKIAESAFSKVLELNHRHSNARFRAGCYLLEHMLHHVDSRTRQTAFNSICSFAKSNTLKSLQNLNQSSSTASYFGSSQPYMERSQLFGQSRSNFNSSKQQKYSNIVQPSLKQSASNLNPYPQQHSMAMSISRGSKGSKRPKSVTK